MRDMEIDSFLPSKRRKQAAKLLKSGPLEYVKVLEKSLQNIGKSLHDFIDDGSVPRSVPMRCDDIEKLLKMQHLIILMDRAGSGCHAWH
jgi:hypothetical protein